MFFFFKELMETAVEFLKLEKVEIGNIKGRQLSQYVVTIYEEFNDVFKVFAERSYDPMDPNNTVSCSNNYIYIYFFNNYCTFQFLI